MVVTYIMFLMKCGKGFKMDWAALQQQFLSQGGLTRVGVRDDREGSAVEGHGRAP